MEAPPILKLYLFKNTGEDHIRGCERDSDMVWSVYDFLCVLFDKRTSTNFGRAMLTRVAKRYGAKVGHKCRAVRLGGGASTPAMTARDLQWLLCAVRHEDLDRAQQANCNLTRLHAMEAYEAMLQLGASS